LKADCRIISEGRERISSRRNKRTGDHC
jgi:hypothetical protein